MQACWSNHWSWSLMQPPSGLHNLDYFMLFIYEVVNLGCIKCNVLSFLAYVPVCYHCFGLGVPIKPLWTKILAQNNVVYWL